MNLKLSSQTVFQRRVRMRKLKVEIATTQKAQHIKLKRIWSTIEYPRQFQYPRECCLLEHLVNARVAVHNVEFAGSGSALRCCQSWRCHRPGSHWAPCRVAWTRLQGGNESLFLKVCTSSSMQKSVFSRINRGFLCLRKNATKDKKPGVLIAEISCWLEEA